MAYDEALAERVRTVLAGQHAIVGKKMFGGIAFMSQGNMACGVIADELIVRVGPSAFPEMIRQPHTHAFDMTGRPMSGWVVVQPEGIATDQGLAEWVQRGLAFALSLPAK